MERSDADNINDLTAGILREASSMSVFCRAHPLEPLRPALAKTGVITAQDLRRIKAGQSVIVTGVLVIVHTPPTKSGKRVMFITMEDETGLLDVVAFPKALDRYARASLTSEVLTVKGRLQRLGSFSLVPRLGLGMLLGEALPPLMTTF
jgi:error-prone DNA polymerase